MKHILKVAEEYDLNLIEMSILVELDEKYPRTVEIEEVSSNPKIERNIVNLVDKGLVEKRWHKYRVKKENLYEKV
ncbi:hypothetical protein ACFO3D_07000 [Virgibacillus kekensis]|uniref:MarR family transcriptional regulator n=1 Tax=Virgibacillus kekensis TaxID=202261 RepID=A0ABV9DGJ0_9BACI